MAIFVHRIYQLAFTTLGLCNGNNSNHLLNTYYLPNAVLNTLYGLFYRILKTISNIIILIHTNTKKL